MAGYANRTIYLGFPELTEEGEREVHVVIKNPKIVTEGEIMPRDLPKLPDGSDDSDAMKAEGWRIIAGLVLAWHVFDATALNWENPEGDQPPLPLPATPETAAKLPVQISKRIMESIQESMGMGPK